MKILYFSQFYTPESIAAAFRANDNAKYWVKKGNNVTIFTGYPNYPIGRIFNNYSPKLLSVEYADQIRILRSKIIAKPNTSIIKRLENALSFFFFGLINIIFNKKRIGNDYDIVLGTSGVIFCALLAYIYSKKNRIPFVFEIRDITYIQMQATGKKRNSLSVIIMKRLELGLCKKAKKVVVVTNGFKKELIEEGIDADKIEVITNGVNIDKSFISSPKKDFVLSYFGTIGISQDLKSTLDYANEMNKYIKNFKYLIIGDGAQKNDLKLYAKDKKLNYLSIKDGMPMNELEKYYSKTILSVITLRKTDNFKYTIPSKLFQIMGRGIAILFIGPEGETSDIIKKYNSGICLTGTPEQDYKTISDFFSNNSWKEKLLKYGINGKKAVEKYYLRDNLSEKYLTIMKDVLKNE